MEKLFTDNRLPFVEGRCSLSDVRAFKSHMHKGLSVGAIRFGQVRFQMGDRMEILTPGDLAFINPETLHSCNPTGNEARSFYMLYLDVQWCLDIQKSLWNIETFIPISCVRLTDDILFAQYIEVMENLMNLEVHLLEKEQLLLDLMATIFKRCALPQASSPVSNRQSKQVEHLKTLLSTELQEELTLADMARQVGANPYTLLRRFKASVGITPHAFRTNHRIELARKYLQQGMDIAEVALQCGFFDQSHLHRHFKAMTTLTPKEYQVNFIQ